MAKNPAIGAKHRYWTDDRCRCGGIVVYYEDPDINGNVGNGCEVQGTVWPQDVRLLDPQERKARNGNIHP
jgi:hypothetical protein